MMYTRTILLYLSDRAIYLARKYRYAAAILFLGYACLHGLVASPGESSSGTGQEDVVAVDSVVSAEAGNSPYSVSPDSREAEPVEIKVTGYGILGNLSLKRTVKGLLLDPSAPTISVNFIEDALVVIKSRLEADGFAQPRITVIVTPTKNPDDTQTLNWDPGELLDLTRDVKATRVIFSINRGVRYYYESLEISGLHALQPEEAIAFYYSEGYLLSGKQNRIYSDGSLSSSNAKLAQALRLQGYQENMVEAAVTHMDHNSGAVTVKVTVTEGPQYRVRKVLVREIPSFDVLTEAGFDKRSVGQTATKAKQSGAGGEDDANIRIVEERQQDQPYSILWQQEQSRDIRNSYYNTGYPDVRLKTRIADKEEAGNRTYIDLEFNVVPGPIVEIGDIRLDGNRFTRDAVIDRRLKLESGELLNPVEVDEARVRLARLGVFADIDIRYNDASGHASPDTATFAGPESPPAPGTGSGSVVRDVIFSFEERDRYNVRLMAGWGSYEQLRVGLEADHRNVFGRTHQGRLRVVQSMKSTSFDYRYSIPEIFDQHTFASSSLNYLVREELSFDRKEWGVSLGLDRYFPILKSRLGLRYRLERVEAEGDIPESYQGLQEARVGSLIFSLNHDMRDNPIYPETGYRVRLEAEAAGPYLGAETSHQRFIVESSFHKELFDQFWIHLGLSHGLITTAGGEEEEISFNKLFFPGGANSVRGYKEGEASPFNRDGDNIGAETYLVFNLELEQALSPQLSVILFADQITLSDDIADYPGNEYLASIGVGVRYKTFLGPLRLEYGQNINPRNNDPAGTLHFSLGFPF